VTDYARPETELLLRCASPGEGDERAERIRALASGPLDWKYLLDAAGAHGLTPLLYWGLRAVRPEVIPQSLAERFQDNTRNSVQMAGSLLQLVGLFAREGISVLPFKGPTLAMAAYGNLALRQFVDLDLYIHKEDALRARDVLMAQGYSVSVQLNRKWEEAFLRDYDELGFRGPAGHPLVELHWGVAPRFFSVELDIAGLWQRSVCVNLANREVPTIGVEDLLFVLCVHASKHCWPRLSMVADIAWLVAASDIRWDEIFERARELGAIRMLLLGTELARRLLEIPLPEQVRKSIAQDRIAQSLAESLVARLALLQTEEMPSGILRDGRFHIRTRERWRDRTCYFVRLATRIGVEDREAADLPSSLAFLYPMLRVPRLLRKYGMRIS
jgi:hypothetical protein